MTQVILAEKPQAAKKIGYALSEEKPDFINKRGAYWLEFERNGEKIIVAPAVGHLFTLKSKEEGWDYPVFDLEWVEIFKEDKSSKYAKKYYDNLREVSNKADKVIVGTDYDQEGDALAFLIIKHIFDLEDSERMKFSTLTSSELNKSYENRLEGMDLGQAQAGITRHILDFYHGVNLSRALIKAVKANDRYKTLSIGRVQGPTLKLLAEKEKEIQKFEPEPYWQLKAKMDGDKGKIKALHKNKKFMEEEKVDKVKDKCIGSNAKVSNAEAKKFKSGPFPPFNLGDMQSEAYSAFGFSPSKTLNIAQSLYDNSYISYPRTSSQKLPPRIGYKNILKKLKNQEKYEKFAKKILDKSKISPRQGSKTDPAHPAIYPTGTKPKKFSNEEKKLYDLIAKRFISCFGEPAIRKSLKLKFNISKEEFKASGKWTLKKNWMKFYKPYLRYKENEIPVYQEGNVLEVLKIEKIEKETKPPRRYSQSSLIKKLEKMNLGTKCLTGDQKIRIIHNGEEKSLPVSSLFVGSSSDNSGVQLRKLKGHKVVTFGTEFEESNFGGMSRRKIKEDEKIFKIKLDGGSTIKVTEDHPILIKSGDSIKYKSAKDLKIEERLVRSHRGSKAAGAVIEFEEFLSDLVNSSSSLSLYGDINLKKYREKSNLSQSELAEILNTSQGSICQIEKRGHGLLRYREEINLENPNYLSSSNFDLKIKNPFPLRISPSFMRVVGMLQGDGSFDSSGREIENKTDYRYHNTEKELINRFREDIENIFEYSPEIRSQPPSTGSKKRYYIQLPAVIGRVIKLITDNFSGEWIEKQRNKDHYVGALLADEGHVLKSEPKIFISNKDFDILRVCKKILKDKNIETTLNKNQYKLYIRGRKNIEKFLEKIPIYSTRKHQSIIDLLERHYRFGTGISSVIKEKNIFKELQSRPKTTQSIAEALNMSPPVIKYHLDQLRDVGLVKKIYKGISECPRKLVLYKAERKLYETFYSEIGEEAIGSGHTATIDSIEEEDYRGYVYDIINSKENNFLLDNQIVVHNSTRSEILEKLYKRNYVKGKSIEVTDLGLAVIKALEKHCPDVISEELTRKFEKDLGKIKKGKKDKEKIIEEAEGRLRKILKKMKDEEKEIGSELIEAIDETRKKEKEVGECPECGETLRIIRSKKSGKRFVGCSGYSEGCDVSYPLPQKGKVVTTDKTCNECGAPIVKIIKKGKKPWWLCINPDCPKKKDKKSKG